ncbi:MAG: HAMP domain-containing sensor histidine kinase [Sedimentibacter saalensis]|uniref:histidine kinase n=1 Tax=Sedimentibacter saalensis TaxID=130788 RepID=A0A562JCQ2_9FIRM|nr:HAMP domain-containing sensor histidine kinase [Sedimentibacter saalensis]MEA5095235.1 HAMP domain-containing sensor histidine kinase [Sedimentibacter saalensis]TWH80725.1 signal transduction histidine kinase [Sedimentibacter saalensis]
MKNKIARKLIIYFSAALLIFAVVIGSIFMSLFKNNTIEIHKNDIERRALNIAETISELLEGSSFSGTQGGGMGMGMGMGGMYMQGSLGSYLRNVDDIAMADVWIVDENLNLLTIGPMAQMHYTYSDMPEDADVVVKDVFDGSTTFSEGFSDMLRTPTLTVGTPIVSGNQIIGALLIHSPVEGMNDAIFEGFKMLVMSIAIALVLSIVISVFLAMYFTKPLKKMKSTALVLAEGDYTAKTGIVQDDEIGELAATIDVLSERLDKASHESERLQKQRQDFITNISHELRTPVTVIRGSLEAICDGVVKDPDQVKEYNKQMLNESKGLERLVNDLLELSRLQNSDFKIEMHEINLCDVIRDAVRSASNMARKKNIIIDYAEDRDIFMIKGDYGRLRQMFMIVIDNAIKFSKESSIIYLNLKNNTVEVRDTGIGISREDMPYIFNRYYRIKTEENKTGTGLGLTIAQQIANRHNVEMSAESEPGTGTSFKFEFK